MKKILLVLLIIISVASIGYCFKYFSIGNLTSNEQVLFSIFLTITSFFLSWFVSHLYYDLDRERSIKEIKEDYDSSLKKYATKAAEKVTNLSAELTKLSAYLEKEISDNEYQSEQDNLNAKIERMYSVIHILGTLKSINDGSLSDWKGIAPDEIEQIAEDERERVQDIDMILNKYRSVVPSEEEVEQGFEDEGLKEEIKELNKKIDLAIGNIVGITRKPKRDPVKKEKLEKPCPNCSVLVHYKQKPSQTSRKNIKCENCKTKLACRWSEGEGFSLYIYDESLHGFNFSEKKIPEEIISEEIIEMVKSKLPVQPWPKKIRDIIAEELGLPNHRVGKAISILIKRGYFKQQIDGILYVPESHILLSDQDASVRE